MRSPQTVLTALTASATLLIAGCGSGSSPMVPSPAPPAPGAIANVYILPGAVGLAANAFGDEPIVIYTGEQMRWRNLDTVEHHVVADAAALPEFATTGDLIPGAERTFLMNTRGMTKIHCTIHPQMTGTLIVQAR